MNLLLNIPKEERANIVQSIKRIDQYRHKTGATDKDIIYLFDLWNTYVQPHNQQDIGCKGCRTNIFSKYKHYSKEWTEWKEQEQSL